MRAFCARCGVPTDRPVTVGEKHAASAGGITIRWCPPCAEGSSRPPRGKH